MKRIFENLVNGNLHDAKVQAQSMSAGWEKLSRFAQDELGWSKNKSDLAAQYLKGNTALWQAYCDAE